MMNEAYEDQQGMYPNVPYQNPMTSFSGSIVQLTNPEEELTKMELVMRNQRINSDNEFVSIGEPIMNEQGISSVVGQVRSVVNQVSVMSNLNDDFISNLTINLADTMIKDLMMNRKKYAITNVAARDKIFTIAINSAFICMRRSLEEGERRFWKGSQQEITMRNSATENQGGSVWSKLMGWRR